jgi:hypothetical protein
MRVAGVKINLSSVHRGTVVIEAGESLPEGRRHANLGGAEHLGCVKDQVKPTPSRIKWD